MTTETQPDPTPPGLGRHVLFTDRDGTTMPAIVNGYDTDGGILICALHPVFGPLQHKPERESTDPGPNTWRWPARPEPQAAPQVIEFPFDDLKAIVDAGVAARLDALGLTAELVDRVTKTADAVLAMRTTKANKKLDARAHAGDGDSAAAEAGAGDTPPQS